MKFPTALFCVDPSIKCLGWAFFDNIVDWTLVESGKIRATRGIGNWTDRLDWVVEEAIRTAADNLDRARLSHSPPATKIMVIELPDHQTVAAAGTGSILKLISLVFALRERAKMCEWVVKLVPVRTWKGNVDKSITQRRARRHWGWQGKDHNEADAVGIGDWAIRKGKLVR